MRGSTFQYTNAGNNIDNSKKKVQGSSYRFNQYKIHFHHCITQGNHKIRCFLHFRVTMQNMAILLSFTYICYQNVGLTSTLDPFLSHFDFSYRNIVFKYFRMQYLSKTFRLQNQDDLNVKDRFNEYLSYQKQDVICIQFCNIVYGSSS